MTTMPTDPFEGRDPDITARVDVEDTAYWRTHPDVVGAVTSPERSVNGGEGYRLSLWLRPPPDEFEVNFSPPYVEEPARAPNFEVGGDLPSPSNEFIERLPNVECLQLYIDAMGDPEFCPRGFWLARIWVSPVPSTGG